MDINSEGRSILKETLFEEYKALKSEQLSRILFRDKVFQFNFAAIATILAVSFKSQDIIIILLAPLVTIVFGWTYLMNDVKVSHIGSYFREVLSQRIYTLLKQSSDIKKLLDGQLDEFKSQKTVKDGVKSELSMFLWEFYHADDPLREERKKTQQIIDLIAFPYIGIFISSIYICFFFYSLCVKKTWDGDLFTLLGFIFAMVLLVGNIRLVKWIKRSADKTKHSSKLSDKSN